MKVVTLGGREAVLAKYSVFGVIPKRNQSKQSPPLIIVVLILQISFEKHEKWTKTQMFVFEDALILKHLFPLALGERCPFNPACLLACSPAVLYVQKG